ncbi:MAG TPA: cysteine--tRNA ligase [Anaerolineales bacterium]|nr:cysteine--tRNA ligase [Anaerolineales bacterium]
MGTREGGLYHSRYNSRALHRSPPLPLKLYNTLSREIQEFAPQGSQIGIYVCGITPYDTTHLGHAFTYSVADVLIRYLEYQGGAVRYVQNVTDVDDDLLRVAGERQEDWRRMGDRWTAHYIEDMAALNIRPPDVLPRATDVMPQIIESVEQLLQAGVAYVAGGSVYFDLKAWPAYGRLSRLPPDQMLPIANERGNRPDDPNKRQPLDFVLWQPQAPGEPAWDSPWGPGRPGWHIECSTMASQLIGQTVDLHAGGEDLVFPHHESEIAQTESLTGKPFAGHWLHVAPVRHLGEKISKSLGNLVMVRDLLDRWSPDAIRVYLASHHYRHSWAYDAETLYDAARDAQGLAAAAALASAEGESFLVDEFVSEFARALEQDLNTPEAIAVLRRLAESIVSASIQGGALGAAQDVLRKLGGVLGLRLGSAGPEGKVVEGWRRHLTRFRSEPVPG